MTNMATPDPDVATLINGDVVPRYLYRYLTINDLLLESINEGYLWFTDPKIFNDPYDCNLRLKNTLSDDTIENYLNIVNVLTKQWSVEELQQNIEYFKAHKNEVNDNLDKEFIDVVKQCAVCCLSERPDILLMWSHYAQKHTGVCLKYDLKEDATIFHPTSLVKVHYPEHYPEFDFMKYVINNKGIPSGNDLLQFTAGMKSKDWQYEHEIRLVRWEKKHGAYKGKIGINKKALVGAYFGYRTKEEDIVKVLNAINGSGYKLKEVMKGYLNNENFGMKFAEYHAKK